MQPKKFHEHDLETYSFMLQMVLFVIAGIFLSNQSSVVVLLIIFGFGFLNLVINCEFSGRMDSYWNTIFINELGFNMAIPDHPSDIKPYLNTIQKLKQVNGCSLSYFKLIKRRLLRINVLSSTLFVFILVLSLAFPKTDTTTLISILATVLACLVLVEVFSTIRIFKEYHDKLILLHS
jgi:hypothetical protein